MINISTGIHVSSWWISLHKHVNNHDEFTYTIQLPYPLPCSVPKLKNAMEPTRTALSWNPSSKRASGWLVDLFSFWYWTCEQGGQLKSTLYLQAHMRLAQPPVLLLHSRCQLGPSLYLHPLQPLQPGHQHHHCHQYHHHHHLLCIYFLCNLYNLVNIIIIAINIITIIISSASTSSTTSTTWSSTSSSPSSSPYSSDNWTGNTWTSQVLAAKRM